MFVLSGSRAVADGAVVGADTEWSCPHEAHPETDRCVFHLSADERDSLGVDTADVADRLRALFEATDPAQKQALGADLPSVYLSYRHLDEGSRHAVDLRYSDVDELDLSHTTVESPVDLRGARLGRLDLTEADVENRLLLSEATVAAEILAVDARFEEEVEFDDAAVAGPVSFVAAEFDDEIRFDETVFEKRATFAGAGFHGRSNIRDDNTSFAGAHFRGPATFTETLFEFADFESAVFDADATFEAATFDGAVVFDDVVFETEADFDSTEFLDNATFRRTTYSAAADFRGAVFHGGASIQHDDADFEAAVFHGPAYFGDAEFTFADFEDVVFEAEAEFEAARFTEATTFDDAVFEGPVDFDEGRFEKDATFRRTEYHDDVDFRGAEFDGGANVLEDDADFEAAVFYGPARFGQAEFAYCDFVDATFEDEAVFQSADLDGNADFHGSTFEGDADFDEARFRADGDFTDAVFGATVDFRGVVFSGATRYLDDARFEGATFRDHAAFDDAVFTAANFRDVTFAAGVDFRHAVFEDCLQMTAESVDGTTYVDMTSADIAEGTIVQPDDHWVRYDLTRARLGDVSLSGDDGSHQLFDYFRFLETDFDGFDFSEHRGYLDRNDWELHVFEEADADHDFAVAATPAAIETTYLYAYNNAKAMGDNDAAIEFSIHRAKFRRKKNVGYVGDGSQSLGYRLGKLGDMVGNTLWYQTCGYGYRLWRILAASVFVVLAWGVMYALPFTQLDDGMSLSSYGALFSGAGVDAVSHCTYYSLITFTTVGYGDINPSNTAARMLAMSEGVLGVLLAALVVFVLGHRVAV